MRTTLALILCLVTGLVAPASARVAQPPATPVTYDNVDGMIDPLTPEQLPAAERNARADLNRMKMKIDPATQPRAHELSQKSTQRLDEAVAFYGQKNYAACKLMLKTALLLNEDIRRLLAPGNPEQPSEDPINVEALIAQEKKVYAQFKAIAPKIGPNSDKNAQFLARLVVDRHNEFYVLLKQKNYSRCRLNIESMISMISRIKELIKDSPMPPNKPGVDDLDQMDAKQLQAVLKSLHEKLNTLSPSLGLKAFELDKLARKRIKEGNTFILQNNLSAARLMIRTVRLLIKDIEALVNDDTQDAQDEAVLKAAAEKAWAEYQQIKPKIGPGVDPYAARLAQLVEARYKEFFWLLEQKNYPRAKLNVEGMVSMTQRIKEMVNAAGTKPGRPGGDDLDKMDAAQLRAVLKALADERNKLSLSFGLKAAELGRLAHKRIKEGNAFIAQGNLDAARLMIRTVRLLLKDIRALVNDQSQAPKDEALLKAAAEKAWAEYQQIKPKIGPGVDPYAARLAKLVEARYKEFFWLLEQKNYPRAKMNVDGMVSMTKRIKAMIEEAGGGNTGGSDHGDGLDQMDAKRLMMAIKALRADLSKFGPPLFSVNPKAYEVYKRVHQRLKEAEAFIAQNNLDAARLMIRGARLGVKSLQEMAGEKPDDGPVNVAQLKAAAEKAWASFKKLSPRIEASDNPQVARLAKLVVDRYKEFFVLLEQKNYSRCRLNIQSMNSMIASIKKLLGMVDGPQPPDAAMEVAAAAKIVAQIDRKVAPPCREGRKLMQQAKHLLRKAKAFLKEGQERQAVLSAKMAVTYAKRALASCKPGPDNDIEAKVKEQYKRVAVLLKKVEKVVAEKDSVDDAVKLLKQAQKQLVLARKAISKKAYRAAAKHLAVARSLGYKAYALATGTKPYVK